MYEFGLDKIDIQ